ncbi:MAG: hypothetical protein Q9180_004151 [Flavoplaca navasiana]
MWFRAIDARYATIKPAHAKTCKWLLQRSEYRDWLDVAKISAHHGLLWIKGKPGSGKSTLLKFVVQSVRKGMRTAIVICFFFNARGEDLEKSTLGMYRSLLSQLLRAFTDIQDILDNFKSGQDAETFDWQIHSLQTLFAAAIRRLGERHLICFIDALDESNEDQIRDLVVFLEELGRPTATSPTNFRVCLSSRHYPHISIGKAIEMKLEGQEGHDQDIASFLSSELKAGSGKVFETIKNEILDRASGVFLWVALVVQILNKEYDHGRIHALRKRLKEIPDGLDRLFEDILTRDNSHFEELILCLQWILYAQHPLRREELYYAILSGTDAEALTPWDPELVTAQDMDKFILSSSKGLAETTKSKSQTVQFIHESVRDYLLGKNGINRLRNELDLGQSHERLRHCCCIYMDIDISEDLFHDRELPKASTDEGKELRTQVTARYPLLQYSVHNVLFHADNASRHSISQELFLQRFPMDRWILLENVFERYQIRRRNNDHRSSLMFITTVNSLADLTRTLVQSYLKHSNHDDRYFSVTLAAVLFDHRISEDTIKARFLPFRQDDEGYQNAIKFIVESWPSFLASKTSGFLPWAASSGLATIFRSLSDIDVIGTYIYDRKDAHGRTLLALAAHNGHHATVELLLAHKANSNILDKERKELLFIAVANGDEAMVKLLLVDEAACNFRDKEGRTPLMIAVSNGDEALVKLLLVDEAACNIRDKEGRTPLMIAVSNGDEALVKLLLVNEAACNIRDKEGRTPLMIAVSNGDEALVKLLLFNKGTLNPPDKIGRALVDLLLGDPVVLGHGEDSPLDISSENGYEAFRLLIANEADLKIASAHGLLGIAAKSGFEAFVKLLLEHGADPNTRELLGDSPMWIAAKNGRAGVMKLLIEYGAVTDELREVPLYDAISAGYEGVVELLLASEAGSAYRSQDLTGFLNVAARKAHGGIFKLLLDHIAGLDSQDGSRNTALTYAASAGHEAVVELLLSSAANSDHQGGYSRRDLDDAARHAASCGHLAIVDLLLAKQHGHINDLDAPS